MSTLFKTSIHASRRSILCLGLLASFTATAPLVASDASTTHVEHSHGDNGQAVTAKLVELVRQATQQFTDVNAATAAGYQPFLGCVSGPDEGAMGVHYVNGTLVASGVIDATKPQALIYEKKDGLMTLVGVEFIADSATWLAHHSGPPVLEGQSFQFVASPNRYGLASFFELHVWAWKDNPNGAFVDWNKRVSCADYDGE